MIRRKTFIVVAAALASISVPAFSQQETGDRNEVTVQAFGSFVENTTSNGVQQSATDSGGVLASYRFLFNNNNGVEVNYGYSLNTQNYYLPGGSVGVKSNTHEISAAYVFRYPLRHWTPFVLAGASGLIFDPSDVPGVGSQSRAAFLYGGGADFSLSAHFFVRAEYRGFVYDSPTYDIAGLNGYDRFTHRAEPSIGFGFRL